MSELSVREQEVLDFLINFIETEIFIIEEEEREKGRLDYSLCFNDDEKLIMTKKKIKKFKARIHDCNPVIAGYLNVLTSPYPSNFEYDELKLQITTNFLFSDYSELFEDLAKEDITELENYPFKSVLKSMGYKYKNLKDLIQGIADVNSFLGYKSILEISLNLNEKSNEVQNDKKNYNEISPLNNTNSVKTINNIPGAINSVFNTQLPDQENPHPKIFKNRKAFEIFRVVLDEFGNTKENLSNYSFVFHKMTYEDLIHNDIKQKSYYNFLSIFDINIDRIKSLADIGKIAYRESIYAKAKK